MYGNNLGFWNWNKIDNWMIRSISGKWSAAFGNKLYFGARQDPNPASMSEENRISVLINND